MISIAISNRNHKLEHKLKLIKINFSNDRKYKITIYYRKLKT